MVALDRTSGAPRWSAPAGGASTVTLAGAADAPVVVSAGTDGRVSARDLGTGATRWSLALPGAPVRAPLVQAAAGLVVATQWSAESAGLTALEAGTGRVRWSLPLLVSAAAPALGPDVVVVAHGDGRRGRVEARDLATGAARWSTPAGRAFASEPALAIDGDAVVAADADGVAWLLDLATGRPRWSTPTGWAPLAGGRIVLEPHTVSVLAAATTWLTFSRERGAGPTRRQDRGIVRDMTAAGAMTYVLLAPFSATGGVPGWIEARSAGG